MAFKFLRPALGAVAVATTFAIGAPASAAETVTWRFSHWVPTTHIIHSAFEMWANELGKATGGAVKVEIFTASQLGDARDHYNMARDGIADLTWAVPGYDAGRFPIYAAGEIPFLFSDATRGARAYHEWYAPYAATEMADVKLCLVTLSPVGTLNFTNKKIENPSELKGLRLRPSGTTLGRYITALGGVSVQMPGSEARQAFQRGLLDGIPFPWRTLVNFGLQNDVKYHMDLPFYSAPASVVINRKSYDRLAENVKKTVDSFCTPERSEKVMAVWDAWEAEGRQMLESKPDHVIYKVSDADAKAWRNATQTVRDEWMAAAKSKGLSDPEAAWNKLIQVLKTNEALL